MGSEMQEAIRARAIEWHIRLRDGDDSTWEAFADWLAEDPRHAEAYDQIEQMDLAIEPILSAMTFREAANDPGVPAPAGTSAARPRRWVLAAGALAATIVFGIAIAPQLTSDRYDVVTAAGESRIVTLDPVTRVTLNGATRMTFDRKDSRFASLEAGEALFHVRHDGARPFRLEVGSNRVENAGTVFNVVYDEGAVRVAVAEGKVVYNPGKDAIPLTAGQSLIDKVSSETIEVAPTPAAAVGAWQRGQLVYAGEPLSRVAADLSRSVGIRIAVSPEIADRPFHGTIALDTSGPKQLDRLMRALDVTLEAHPDGWVMKP